MPREITINDLEELARTSNMGVLDMFSLDDVDEKMAADDLSATRVLVKLRSQPDFSVGRFIVLEVIDAPRLYYTCRECGCTNKSCCMNNDSSPPDRCYWVEPDLCSACAPRAHPNLKPEDSRDSVIIPANVNDVLLLAKP